MGSRGHIREGWIAAWLTVVAALCAAPAAHAANPPAATLTPNAQFTGSVSWTGTASIGTELLLADAGAACFGPDNRPNPASGCDVFALDVATDAAFYVEHPGAVSINATGFGLSDLDMYVYRRNADGTRADFVTGDGQILGTDENVAIDKASGSYFVVLTPYTVVGSQNYSAKATLVTRQGGSITQLEAAAPKGSKNYRASRDKYTSHSEPTIAMDPLDHNHLMAGSKMYENNEKYLFKVGTYESFDGGRTWKDLGHLPGYCEAPGQCDPSNEVTYRTTSDPTIDFDDEGNVYINVLDAPGGTNAFQGFNMTVHTKRPGKDWSGPTVVHNNRTNALTTQLFLDDKNWIAVDNNTDVNGGANAPRDGKIGTMYICWSFDGTGTVPLQQIVVMRSRDGGKTWGGITPNDNLPFPISQKTLISGIGCHIAIGPKGEVYATWYDNQLNALMQAKSENRGALWTPAVPIAGIAGVNEPFLGEAFRNLSIPTTAVDNNGTVYVAVASRNAQGNPLLGNLLALGKQIKAGTVSVKGLQDLLSQKKANNLAGKDYKAGGDGLGPMSGSDIVLFKSSNGGRSYTGPVRVNQDSRNGDADQFQPWMDVTECGQINISFFDRRNDPANYFIDTWLARSEDGGRDLHRPACVVAHVGSGGQRADVGVGQVHRRLPGARRRRQRRDPVLERHAAQQPAEDRSGVLALPGGLRGARAQRRRGGRRAHALRPAQPEGRPALDRPPVAARDARRRRPAPGSAGPHGARRAALLRQGRRQRARSLHEEGSRRLRRHDGQAAQAPGHRPRQHGQGAASVSTASACASRFRASTACGRRARSTSCSGRGAAR